MSRARLAVWLIVVVVAVGLSAWGIGRIYANRPPRGLAEVALAAKDNGDRPECPRGGAWSEVLPVMFHPDLTHVPVVTPGLTSPFTTGRIAVAGMKTDVPEFHDCQQFIVQDTIAHNVSLPHFNSLFAVFAADGLENLDVEGLKANPSPTGVPIGEIFAYADFYKPLGIAKGFNCLYLHAVSGPSGPSDGTIVVSLSAFTVPVGIEDSSCVHPRPSSAGTELQVTPLTVPWAVPDDYPPVARWDYDPVNNLQYIGIRCGAAWCEIHAPNAPFTPSAPYRPLDTIKCAGTVIPGPPEVCIPTPHPQGVLRRAELKGWYDEQQLAVTAPNGKLTPGNMVGTVIPDPELGKDHGSPDTSRYVNSWVRVGTIGIRGDPGPYTKKLNLVAEVALRVPVDTMFLCYWPGSGPNGCFTPQFSKSRGGSAANTKSARGGSTTTTASRASIVPPTCTADTRWFGKITAPGLPPKFFCTTRRAHDGVTIPGMVRWRWMLHDDTIWVRCLDGCCEIEPDK